MTWAEKRWRRWAPRPSGKFTRRSPKCVKPAQGLLTPTPDQLVTSKKSQLLGGSFSPQRANTPRRDTHSNPPDLAICPAERRRNPSPSPKRTRSWRTRYVPAHPRPFHNSQNYASRPRATAAARDRGADPAQAARGAANRRRRFIIFRWIDDGDAPRCNLTRGLAPDLGTWPRAPAPIITIIS